MNPTQPLYWSIRRELWENRSVYIGPLVAVSLVLFGFVVSAGRLPHKVRGLSALTPLQQHHELIRPYAFAAGFAVVAAFVVGLLYCLDALYGERRDRSLLFWKSLPVSDRTAVLAKAAIPLAVLPVFCFVIILLAQLLMLILSSMVLAGSGVGTDALHARLPLFQLDVALLWSLIAIALWHAPLYAWLLLLSGWAKRAVFLWAVFPPLVLGAFERIVFGTSHFGRLMRDRLIGWYALSFDHKLPGGDETQPLSMLTPGRFLATPGLWIGLLLAAAFLAAAVRMRRDREPI
jgi:ABC-2 type transport system permease protein